MAEDEFVLRLGGRFIIFVYSHVLAEVVVPAEILAAAWIWTPMCYR
jgi:hypothetical protein